MQFPHGVLMFKGRRAALPSAPSFFGWRDNTLPFAHIENRPMLIELPSSTDDKSHPGVGPYRADTCLSGSEPAYLPTRLNE